MINRRSVPPSTAMPASAQSTRQRSLGEFQRPSLLKSDMTADDLGWEAMSVIGGGLGHHLGSLAQHTVERQPPLT
jgi:hypothetical protein